MAYRFSLIIAGIIGAYAFLLIHLYQIQLVKGNYYLAKADSEIASSQGRNGTRGAIYFTDKDGIELPAAIEKQFPIIYAVPTAIEDAPEAANTFASILGMPVSTLEKIFSKKNDSYELLIRKADPAIADAVEEKNIKGVYADVESDRYYPLGPVGSQALGYVGPNASNNGESGHYGLEAFYDDYLEGPTSSIGGQDLQLTIDPNIQIEAEKILDDLVVVNGATGGSVMVEDPQTGKILAMGAYPSFDPNDYASSPVANFLNPNVQAVYEPGSIIKVLTMAAGIDSGNVSPNSTYDDVGYVNVNGAHITNYNLTTHGPYGPGTTMSDIIEHSINTGAIWVENRMGNPTFTEYMKKFRLGEKTGIDLPGEVSGNLSQLNSHSPQVVFDTSAYGQGISMTPIELMTAVAGIANGGMMMRPYLNAADTPQELGRAVSSSTARTVATMMVSAIDNISGAPAISGYSLAGKTGSAYIPNPKGGGYLNQLDDSYIGFGPTSNPRFVAFIRLNTLPVTALAAESVVPAFKNLAQFIINYYNIPPDRPDTATAGQ